MSTSISGSKSKWRWAAIAQLFVIAHTVLFAVYIKQGSMLFAIGALCVIVVLSYFALQLAWQAGVQWPSGKRGDT